MEQRRLARSKSDQDLGNEASRNDDEETITLGWHFGKVQELAMQFCTYIEALEQEFKVEVGEAQAKFDRQREIGRAKGKQNHEKKDLKIQALQDEILLLKRDNLLVTKQLEDTAFMAQELLQACSDANESLKAARSLRDQATDANDRNIAIIKNQQKARKKDQEKHKEELQEHIAARGNLNKRANLATIQRDAAHLAKDLMQMPGLDNYTKAVISKASSAARDQVFVDAMLGETGSGGNQGLIATQDPDLVSIASMRPGAILETLGIPRNERLEKVLVYYRVVADLLLRRAKELEGGNMKEITALKEMLRSVCENARLEL